jgi:S1-C subfamily serine protease
LTPAPKLLGSVRLKLRLALASLAVLVIGSLIAPRATETRLSPPQERAAPLLEEQAQSREIARPFSGIQQVRHRISDLIVAFPSVDRPAPKTALDYQLPAPAVHAPAGYGIVVTPAGDILTHVDALSGRTRHRIDNGRGGSVEATVVGYEPATGLVLLSTPGMSTEASQPALAAPAEPGALVAAYFRSIGRETIVPVFITSATRDEYAIVSTGPPLLPGTPIYTLAGELLAIAAGSAERPLALPAREAAERLVARVRSGGGQPASIGVTFQALDGPVTRVFGQTGALVGDVVSSGPGAEGGIEAGDLLLAVGETIVESPEAAHHAIVSLPLGSAISIRVRRDDRTLTLSVTPSAAIEVLARAVDDRARAEVPLLRAGDVFSASALAAAGVRPDAGVISVNRRRVSSRAQALGELQRSRAPALVHLENQDRERFFAVLDRPS